MAYTFGRQRWVPVDKLQAGHQLCEPIRGYRGKVLVDSGEILSQKHVDQILKWCRRPGAGSLKLYTREVRARVSRATGDERPPVDSDPYKSIAVQKYYRRHK